MNYLKVNRKDLLLILPCQNCPYLKDNCNDYDDLGTNFDKNLCEHGNNRHQEYRTRSRRLVKRSVRYDDFVMS